MKAFLLSAGLGTRLRPITGSLPKCLVPIHGKPLLEHWIDRLFGSGRISEILVNTHYLPDPVNAFIKTSPYGKRIFSVHETALLGTAGSLLQNESFFDQEPLMLIHADNYSIFSMDEFILAHDQRPSECILTMMTFETDAPETCGIVELDHRGVVTAFHEKEKPLYGNQANGAVYILEPGIFGFLKARNKSVIDFSTEVLPHFLGKIFTFENKGYHRDIGTPESYQKAQEMK